MSKVSIFYLRKTYVHFQFRDDVRGIDTNSSKEESSEVTASAVQGGGDRDSDKQKGFRFKPATTETEMLQLSGKQFAQNTDRKINWAVDLFVVWRKNRMLDPDCPSEILWMSLDNPDLNKSHLCYSLCAFVNEIRRKDGADFPGRTLYDLVLCMQFYLEKKGTFWHLIEYDDFKQLKFTVDNLMKSRAAARLGVRSSANAISFDQEEILWAKRILGKENPTLLRNTVMYLIGISFALRGGEEHRKLRCPPFHPQIRVGTDVDDRKFLEYVEDPKSKTNQGGISSKNFIPKHVKVYGNSNFNRDLVRLYTKYVGLLPAGGKCSALYKYSLVKRRPNVWYTDKPVGVNSLKKVVSDMMKDAGIEGRFTNHSLRATTATRMYDKGIDEQLIKEVTGHKSDAVQIYKHTSETLMEKACKTVVQKEGSEQAPKSSSADFDIDSVDLTKCEDTEKFVWKSSGGKCHKQEFCPSQNSGKCGGLCEFLKKLDQVKERKRDVKRLRLSLKFGKNK